MDNINLKNSGLTVMPNLRYSNATVLDISQNRIGITNQIFFPYNLVELNISETIIRGNIDHTNLPRSLEKLIITHNLITQFDGSMFLNLGIMDISNNILTKFIFPPNIRDLKLSNNRLTELDEFPMFLEDIVFVNNNLTKLPIMNQSLLSIDFSDNNISNIDSIPDTVEYINGENNRIVEVKTLPEALVNLNLNNNLINKICDIPSCVMIICMNDNKLVKLPRFGRNVEKIYVKNNNIRTIYDHDLPPKLGYLNIKENPLQYIHGQIKSRITMKFLYDNFDYTHSKYNDDDDEDGDVSITDFFDDGPNDLTSIYDDYGSYFDNHDKFSHVNNYGFGYEQFNNNHGHSYSYYGNNNNNNKNNYKDTNLTDPLCVSVYNSIKIQI